ncbi:MAG: hypothetical protein ABR506_02740 [Candidatus Krumholzibacteriia bacterium]
MAPRKEFEEEERKLPSKRSWQPKPERGDDQPRAKKPVKPKRPGDVVWDWEDDLDVENDGGEDEDTDPGEEVIDDDAETEQDDVVWDDDDR